MTARKPKAPTAQELTAATDFQAPEPQGMPPMAPTATDHLMEIALSQGKDGVEALRELVALRREEQEREAARAFAADLARFKSRAPSIGKDAAGAHSARYATRDHIMARIGTVLSDCGFSVTFDEDPTETERLRMFAIVRHRDGHTERGSATVDREAPSNRMNATQAGGSAMEYARRYAVINALGLSAGADDDDGQAAGPGNAAEERITAEQVADLRAKAEEVGADKALFLKWMGVERWEDIAASRHEKAVAGLERKR